MTQIKAFTMPKWGIEMTEGTLGKWMVNEGESFKRGQTLCLIETDKITNEVEAEFASVVKKIIIAEGVAPQPVGTLLAVFADASASDADVAAFIGSFKAANTSVAAKSAAPATVAAPQKIETNRPISPEALKLAEALAIDLATVTGTGKDGRISFQDVQQANRVPAMPTLKGAADLAVAQDGFYASPLAKRLATQHGIALGRLKGTGPRGRISKADVQALVQQPRTAATFSARENNARIVPMDKIRKIVARRLTESKQNIPHFYLRMTVAVDTLLALRKSANLVLGIKASINDFLVRAAALALAQHPDINIQVHGDAIHHFAHADISIAVATKNGLLTPIVRGADQMRLDQLASATAALIAKAQAGKLGYADMDGGTFSISNLGMFGIDQFDAIINPPQGAILAVGAISRVMAERADGDVAFESRMALSLSVDHRAIDGAAGASFMATLKALIEAPERLFT
jgi:pyruvate dehydrogenase E2 component (dihydrolipoamide acetyltransferase)